MHPVFSWSYCISYDLITSTYIYCNVRIFSHIVLPIFTLMIYNHLFIGQVMLNSRSFLFVYFTWVFNLMHFFKCMECLLLLQAWMWIFQTRNSSTCPIKNKQQIFLNGLRGTILYQYVFCIQISMCDYFRFRKIKIIRGTCFEGVEAIKKAITMKLRSFP